MKRECGFCGGSVLEIRSGDGGTWEQCEDSCPGSAQALQVLDLQQKLRNCQLDRADLERQLKIEKDSRDVCWEVNNDLRGAVSMANDTNVQLLKHIREQDQPGVARKFFSPVEVAVYASLPAVAGFVESITTKSGMVFVYGWVTALLVLGGLTWVNVSKEETA